MHVRVLGEGSLARAGGDLLGPRAVVQRLRGEAPELLRRAGHQNLGALAEVLVDVRVVFDHLRDADGGELEQPSAGTGVPDLRRLVRAAPR